MAESIDIVRKVLVRSVVTDKLKEILGKEAEQNLSNIEREHQNLSRQREQYVAQCRDNDVKPDYEVMKRMAIEEERMKNSRAQIEAQAKAVQALKNGEEFQHGTVDSVVSVKAGDNWHEVMTGFDVLLDDGIVKEIRRREIKL